MEDEFVTMREAQEILGVSNYTIWKMVKDGRIEVYESQLDRRKKLVRRLDLEERMRPTKKHSQDESQECSQVPSPVSRGEESSV